MCNWNWLMVSYNMKVPFLSSMALMFYTMTSIQVTSSTIHNVSLSWDMEGNVLCLKCFIKNMGLGAYFYGPKGDQKGHCNSPLLANNINEVGKCDNGMAQTILSDNNVLNELKIQLYECENGAWKCTHGLNRNEEDKKDVTMRINVSCPGIPNSFLDRCLCVIPPLVIGYLLGYFSAKQIQHFRRNKNDCWKRDCAETNNCLQYALKKSCAVVMCALIVPLLACIKVLCEDGGSYTVPVVVWSVIIGFLEVFLPDKIISKLESNHVPSSEQQHLDTAQVDIQI